MINSTISTNASKTWWVFSLSRVTHLDDDEQVLTWTELILICFDIIDLSKMLKCFELNLRRGYTQIFNYHKAIWSNGKDISVDYVWSFTIGSSFTACWSVFRCRNEAWRHLQRAFKPFRNSILICTNERNGCSRLEVVYST